MDDQKRITSPIKAIHQFCIECNGGSKVEVKNCTSPKCPLFEFRFGKNPYVKRELTDEQRQAAAERLRKAREEKGGE